MATFEKFLLSASTNGRPIKVVATATPGTNIHVSSALANQIDEIWLTVTNTDSVSRSITIEWGGTTDPDDLVCKSFVMDARSDPVQLIAGLPLAGGLIVKAFGSVASIFVITGFVNRITQ